jgi:RNAse (barnase) inhibitor barstar
VRYEIDGSRFSTLEDFFEEISSVLIPGYSWGHNLEAFNDILRGGFGTPVEEALSTASRFPISLPSVAWCRGIEQ